MMGGLLALPSGCGSDPPNCPQAGSGPADVVLTFDDGPFAADIADKEHTDPEVLLSPLNEILSILAQRNVRAVFYISGPGTDEAASKLSEPFARGVLAIHQAGHVLAYHAFAHDRGIWADPLLPPGIAESMMKTDMDRLEGFIDDSLRPSGLTGKDLFQPVFRQPYGGIGFLAFEGVSMARARGWIYHGFRIDTGDWLVNADADPQLRAALSAETDQKLTDFVGARLKDGTAANTNCGQADVLLHVNGSTAKHLNSWIEELSVLISKPAGRTGIMDVPQSYLQESDSFVDSAVDAALSKPGG